MEEFDVMAFIDEHYYDDNDVVVGCYIETLPIKEPCRNQAPDWYTWRTTPTEVVVFAAQGSVMDSLKRNLILNKYK